VIENIRFNDEGAIRHEVKRQYSVAFWDESTGQRRISATKISNDGARRIGGQRRNVMGNRIGRPRLDLTTESLVILPIHVSDNRKEGAGRTNVVEHCGILAHHGMCVDTVRLVELLVDPPAGISKCVLESPV